MWLFQGLILRRLILVCSFGLLLMFIIPVVATGSSIGLWLMQSLPLLITLRGLIHNNTRSLQCGC